MHSQTQKEVNTTHRLFKLAPLVSLQHLSVVIISDLHRTESSRPLGTVISCRYMHHQWSNQTWWSIISLEEGIPNIDKYTNAKPTPQQTEIPARWRWNNRTGCLLYPLKHKPVSSKGGGLAGKGGTDSTVCLLYPQKCKPVSFRVEGLLVKAAMTAIKNANLSPLGWRACWRRRQWQR